MKTKVLNHCELDRLVSLRSSRFAVSPVTADGFTAGIHKSKSGTLIGEIRFDNQGYYLSQTILVQLDCNNLDIKALTQPAYPAGSNILRCMQEEAIRQGESVANVNNWYRDAVTNQKRANRLARTVGCAKATEIIFGGEDKVISYAKAGYRVTKTGEYVSVAGRNNVGWVNTFYQYAQCKVQLIK